MSLSYVLLLTGFFSFMYKVPYNISETATSISKVVRPLQIKDHSCMCTGGGLQQALCGSSNYLWNQIQETS